MSNKLKIYLYYLKYKHQKFKDREKLIKYQNKKIRNQIECIKKKSKFYNDYDSDNLKDFPIMDKKIMMQNLGYS